MMLKATNINLTGKVLKYYVKYDKINILAMARVKKWRKDIMNKKEEQRLVENMTKKEKQELQEYFIDSIDNGSFKLVKLFIQIGVDVTQNDNIALELAVIHGYTKIVKMLIDAGADVTVDENYLISIASDNGYTEIVKMFIDAGADVTANDNWAIKLAFNNGHAEVVNLLKEAGAKM